MSETMSMSGWGSLKESMFAVLCEVDMTFGTFLAGCLEILFKNVQYKVGRSWDFVWKSFGQTWEIRGERNRNMLGNVWGKMLGNL